jgi:hypothetical protein
MLKGTFIINKSTLLCSMIVSSKGYIPDSFKVKEKCRNAKVSIASYVIRDDFSDEYNLEVTFFPIRFIEMNDTVLEVSVPSNSDGLDALERLLAVIEKREEEWYTNIEDINTMLMEIMDDYNNSSFSHPKNENNMCSCGGSTSDE